MQYSKHSSWFPLAKSVAGLAVCWLASIAPAAAQIRTEPQPAISKTAFDASIRLQLSGKVMGYSYVLMKDGRLISEDADGLARNDADGRTSMTPNTPQNLGSLFKFISGMSLLYAFEHAPPGSAGGNNTFDARLDSPINLLYPQFWQSAISNPAIRRITFRQLLQHKSGFRAGSSDDVPSSLSGTFDPRLIGQRDYQNINFGLVGYLLGVYTKPSLLSQANGLPAGTPADNRKVFFQKIAGLQMNAFIRGTVFARAPGRISASCDAANEYKSTGAYTYISKSDKGNGIITSRLRDETKTCVGSGGYWMSVHDFATFAATVLHSDRLISATTRQRIYNASMNPDDRLVWSFTKSDPTIKTNYAMDPILYSGGDQPYSGGQGAHTTIIRLPLGYEVLVFVNSDDLNSSSLTNIGIAAFKAGMAGN